MIATENIRAGDLCKIDNNGRVSVIRDPDELQAVRVMCPHQEIEVTSLPAEGNAFNAVYACKACNQRFSSSYLLQTLWNHFMPLHPKVVGVSDLALGRKP